MTTINKTRIYQNTINVLADRECLSVDQIEDALCWHGVQRIKDTIDMWTKMDTQESLDSRESRKVYPIHQRIAMQLVLNKRQRFEVLCSAEAARVIDGIAPMPS